MDTGPTIDQQRRELQKNNPDLYTYIAAVEAIRVMDVALDKASIVQDVRRVIRLMREQYKTRAEVLRIKPITRTPMATTPAVPTPQPERSRVSEGS